MNKKDKNKKELPKAYEPSLYEEGIYKKWEESGFFNPDNLKVTKSAKPFSIAMPPPNVTGVLHLGHALENTIMDIEARFQRMRGEKVLLIPGTDHAAVATQARVEKEMIKQGIKDPRKELGREELLKRIRQYAENSKAIIIKQIKKMGTSCDWSRLAYTFDEPRSKAVNEIFVRMYNDGLVYRGYRVVNWSVKGQSTCSDDELVYVEEKTKLYTFRYARDFPIAISTTRPETKLGDTAVAVHPGDKRYKKYVGKTYTVDVGASRPLKIKIIADNNIEAGFGTGAVGVTPAHSQIDYELYEKHNLELRPVIGPDGRMTNEAGKNYQGLTVEEARKKFLKWLKQNNLLEKEENIIHNVSTSDRFGDVVEVIPMEQWFVNVNKKIPNKSKTLKDLMREAVTTGHKGNKNKKIKIIPKRFNNQYFHWIDNLRDWCISRQIWWGHRIPVWYRQSKNNQVKILLVRHGQTDWNKNGIMQGQKDVPLNNKGEKDALKLRNKIKDQKFDLIITSPLKRTSKTAELLNTYGVKIIEDKRLKERHYGKFEGKKTAEVLAKHPEIETFKVNGLPYWINVPTAETYDQVKARVRDFLSDIKKKHKGKRVLVVSHGDVLDMFYAVLNNLPNEQAYGRNSLNMRLEKYDLADQEIYVGVEPLKGKNWQQDEDTLDTWFSSGLWTFSTLGWPKKTADLKIYHPTAWMQMGYEILFFWMARMILMSTYAVDDIPFKDVYIHGMLRDQKGRKFSKSLGTGVDPIKMCGIYGTDALRLSLVLGITPGNDSRFYDEKIEGARNFVNKLWNVSKFILQRCDKSSKNEIFNSSGSSRRPDSVGAPQDGSYSLADRWILSKMDSLIKQVTKDIENYRFSQAGESLREFTWSDLADWYLEVSKFEKNGTKDKVLIMILRDLLKLWHPFIPYVTEMVWQEMGNKKLLMIEKWPSFAKATEGKPTNEFELIKDIIIAIRNARAESKVEPSRKIEAVIYSGKYKKLIESQTEIIKGLRTGIKTLEVKASGEKIDKAVYIIVGEIEIYLIGMIDKGKERKRIQKEIKRLKELIKIIETKLADKDFIKRAPRPIVEKEKTRLKEFQAGLKNLEKQIKSL